MTDEQRQLQQLEEHIVGQRQEFAEHQEAVCEAWEALERLEKCSFRLAPAPHVADGAHSQRYPATTPRSQEWAAGIAALEKQAAQLRGRCAQAERSAA